MSSPKPTRRVAATGIYIKHAAACETQGGGQRCTCTPVYQAAVWSARERRRIRRHFATLAAAKAWRADMLVGLRKGTVKAPTRVTLREVADEWIAGAEAGTILNRGRQPYKPSALRGYRRSLSVRVLPELGHMRLSAIDHVALQDLADRLAREGLDASTIRNTFAPLQAVLRRAVKRGLIAVNPAVGLELQAPQGRRDRIADPSEAALLLGALERDRALWATALYGGLRRGELRGLQWDDVDLEANVILVRRSMDDVAGIIEPKTRASRRTVPIAAVLRSALVEHRLARGGHGQDLVFGHADGRPFEPSSVRRRALTAWKRAGQTPIGLHECRHTFASLMIAAGVNPKAIATYMGHSSVTITLDRYGHLMPGNLEQAAGLLDDYLRRAAG